MLKNTRKRLGDLLIEDGLISEEHLARALAAKRGDQKLGDALVEGGYVTEQQLIKVLERQLGIPRVSLFNYPIDKSLTTLFPKEIAKQKGIMPLKKDGEKLVIAMSDPLDFFAIEELGMLTGFQIERVLASKEEIRQAIGTYYQSDEPVEELMSQVERDPTPNEGLADHESPIARIVNQLLWNAVQQRASDVHIDPHDAKLLVRYRIDGLLRTERSLPKNMQNILTARIKIMSNLNITEGRLPQDGRALLQVEGRPIDLRVSTLPTMFGEKNRFADFRFTKYTSRPI